MEVAFKKEIDLNLLNKLRNSIDKSIQSIKVQPRILIKSTSSSAMSEEIVKSAFKPFVSYVKRSSIDCSTSLNVI
jgi:hypothetical protein